MASASGSVVVVDVAFVVVWVVGFGVTGGWPGCRASLVGVSSTEVGADSTDVLVVDSTVVVSADDSSPKPWPTRYATPATARASMMLAAIHSGAAFRDRLGGPVNDVGPVYPYGASKAAAETAVRAVDPGAVLVRTSLILGDEHSRQIRLCLAALAGRATLFTDELRCPVHVTDLADAVLELAGTAYAGTLNVAGADAVSRAELGRLVAARYGLDPAGMPTATVADAGLVRPTDVRLDSSRAAALLTTRLRGAREVLAGRA